RTGPARERRLAAASRLFYAHGMTATGIDAVTAKAGVAKMSLYNNFSSKEELMRAYIEARHREWVTLFRSRAEEADSPTARVLAVLVGEGRVVEVGVEHASLAYEHGFRGCGLLNAAAELPAGSAGRETVRHHKEQVEQILAEELTHAGAEDPAGTAEHLSFLLE